MAPVVCAASAAARNAGARPAATPASAAGTRAQPRPSGAAPSRLRRLVCNGAYNRRPRCRRPVPGPSFTSCSASRSRAGPGHRAADLSLLHPAAVEPAVAGRVGALHRQHPSRRDPRDFKASGRTNFLDDLSIETVDYVFSNGVVGKIVLYNMEERQRVKIVDYVGSKKVEQSKIDEELKKKAIQIRLDSFIDPGLMRRVAGVVRDMYAEKGYEFAEVKPEIKAVARRSEAVNLTFNITEGPKVKIREVDFLGNQAINDRKLAAKMKDNKAPGCSWPSSPAPAPTRKPSSRKTRDKVADVLPRAGLHQGAHRPARAEDPRGRQGRQDPVHRAADSGHRRRALQDRRARRSPATGGRRAKALRPLFKLNAGRLSTTRSRFAKGFEKAKELYGSGGYWEFTGYPDLAFPTTRRTPMATATADAGPPAPAEARPSPRPPEKTAPIVDVTMRMQEGKQYFVNRITFVGNTTTRDNVIRREVRLLEGGVFNTEALKFSVKRINQLGYFKPIEGEAIDVEKTPGRKQGRRHAEVRGAEPQPAHVRRRRLAVRGLLRAALVPDGELPGPRRDLQVSAQQGSRAKNYQLGFTEPFLFDRPITAGVDLFMREIQYIGATRRSRPAATSSGVSRCRTSRGCSSLQLRERRASRT